MNKIFLFLFVSHSIAAMNHGPGNPAPNGGAFYYLCRWIKEKLNTEKKSVEQESSSTDLRLHETVRVYHAHHPMIIVSPKDFDVRSIPIQNGNITFLGPYEEDSDAEQNSQEE